MPPATFHEMMGENLCLHWFGRYECFSLNLHDTFLSKHSKHFTDSVSLIVTTSWTGCHPVSRMEKGEEETQKGSVTRPEGWQETQVLTQRGFSGTRTKFSSPAFFFNSLVHYFLMSNVNENGSVVFLRTSEKQIRTKLKKMCFQSNQFYGLFIWEMLIGPGKKKKWLIIKTLRGLPKQSRKRQAELENSHFLIEKLTTELQQSKRCGAGIGQGC